jgi:signal transduction histidine kinase
MQDLSLHILDLIDNSLAAGADRVSVRVLESPAADRLLVEITDNGRGMDRKTLARALDPFFTTKPGRRAGLGLALFAQAARESGGRLEVKSSPGRGTTLRALFGLSHPDRKPLGDLQGTMDLLAEAHPRVTFEFDYRIGKEEHREAQTRRS